MISSRSNDVLKSIRRLRRSKDDDLVVLEGPHLLQEALASGITLEKVLLTPAMRESPELGPALDRLPAARVALVEPSLLAELADADAPQGIVTLARLFRPGMETLGLADAARVLFLDGIQDPGNLGALVRVAEASAAVDAVALAPGTVHPNHPRAIRASAGSLLRFPVLQRVGPEALDRAFGTPPPVWIGLAPRGGENLWEAPLASEDRLVLALGAEGPGLSAEVSQRLDRRWTIPASARVESLNVAVAGGIVLFELRRRRADMGGRLAATALPNAG